jgi:hypothetical protein
MRKTLYVMILLYFCLNATAVAEQVEIVFQNNEYGGITKQITYAKGDANYDKGMKKVVASYDRDGNQKRMEIYATEDQAQRLGWYKRIIYYWERSRISEAYSTDSDSRKYGFHKMVTYLDDRNRLEKREYYLKENTRAGKLGVYKRVIYYDSKGKASRVVDLDRLGNVVVTE